MGDEDDAQDHAAKRLKTSHTTNVDSGGNSTPLASLSRSITPPRLASSSRNVAETSDQSPKDRNVSQPGITTMPSPFQLSRIRDMPDKSGNNVDTVRLTDILGDPLIKECWQFNYLFDVDFLMNQFDSDVRSLVQVKLVHGSWKREAPNRIRIDQACSRYPNVEPVVAYMPEPFGTHHSKMMVLIRHDDLAQVVIHTANMIPFDWANMCQAVWRSPLLPLLPGNEQNENNGETAIGSDHRFKRDLLAYLEAYGPKRTGPLVQQLRKYDFAGVKAALIASVPSRQELRDLEPEREPLWGWPALKETLRRVPVRARSVSQKSRPHIVTQISSIATLGQSDKWLNDVFFDAISPLSSVSKEKSAICPKPKFSIIFPTPDEIRRSLNGYASGSSIHMKLQSTAQQKQLEYLRPHLCRWTGYADNPVEVAAQAQSSKNEEESNPVTLEAGRRRAAPHIKTYVRFSDEDMNTIDWAMITSANLSTQAWGAAPNAKKEVRICSWEIGVLTWPDLFAEGHHTGLQGGSRLECDKTVNKNAFTEMVPCFKQDSPPCNNSEQVTGMSSSSVGPSRPSIRIGFRMPYDLPLKPYSKQDIPWCATAAHTEPDWLGQTWDTAED